MAKLDILAGATSVSIAVFIQDSSSTTGAGLTGLVFNTSGLTCYAVVPGSSAAAITLATLAAANSAWSSGGFKEIDATNMPGWYRFDVPNTNISTGRSVGIHFKGATNMAPLPLEISLTAVNNQSATAFVSSVPSVVGAVGSVTGLTASNLDAAITSRMATYTQPTGFLAATFPVSVASPTNITAGVITTVTNLTNAPTAGDLTATMKTSVTTAATAATPTAAAVTGAVGSVVGAVGSVTGAVGSVTGAVGSVTGAVGSVAAAVAITSNVKKNQALAKFQFLMTDSTTNAPKTGLTVSVTRSIDSAAYAAGTLANVAEVGSGMYTVDFGAGDLNGTVVVLQATAAGANTTFERIVTQP